MTLAQRSEPAVPAPSDMAAWRGLSVVAFTLVALVLAVRRLYTSPDDANYVAYFAGEASTLFESWWSWLLEEPLWLAYANVAGEALGPEGALRATLFTAALGFLIASSRLARGAWGLVLLSFLLDQSMGSLFFYIQVRNGLALMVFLVALAAWREATMAALIAAFVHTSFLVIVPCALLARMTSASRRPRVALIAGLTVVVFGAALVGRVAESFDFGRRAGMYDAASGSNANFYVLAVAQFLLVIAVAWSRVDDPHVRRLFHLAAVVFVCSLSLTFVHEAAVRLVFISRALSVVTLGACLDSSRARGAAVAWVGILALVVAMEYTNAGADPDSWHVRWQAILSA